MKSILMLLFVLLASPNLTAQESRKLFTLDNNDFGGYIRLGGRFTTVNSLGAGLFDFLGVVVIINKREEGFSITGLPEDKHLNEIVKDDVYHLMASYQGILVERYFDISKYLRCSASLMIGQREIKYRYSRSAIAERKGYEETIDQYDFYIFQPTFDFFKVYRIGFGLE